MSEVPRALEIVAHDDKDHAPIGRKRISPAKIHKNQGEFLNRVVSGDFPLDDGAAEVIREYLDAHHARVR
jgi:hypothetical protein